MRSVVRFIFVSVIFLATAGVLVGPANAGSSQDYAALIATHAAANGIPVELASAVVRHESNFNPRVTGRAGEIGLMQIKLSTARAMGYRGSRKGLYDPETNIRWGMIYLGQAQKLAGGSQCGTLSRYNGGLGRRSYIRSYCRQVMASSVPAVVHAHHHKAKVEVAEISAKQEGAASGNFLKALLASNQ